MRGILEFCDSVVQKTAYELMLFEERRRLHRKVFRLLQSWLPQLSDLRGIWPVHWQTALAKHSYVRPPVCLCAARSRILLVLLSDV